MSYEAKMLKDFRMPNRKDVEQALLKSLFNHGGVIKEFSVGEEIVSEIADDFGLSIEAYNFSCAVCSMKICSPNALQWEVEAAHIVPRSSNGKDDMLNGLAFCRLHHWAFDVGWFTLDNNFRVLASRRIQDLSADFGKIWNCDFMGQLAKENLVVSLPREKTIHPHPNAIRWHRENIFVI